MAIWILYALLSAFFASLVVIFGKMGVQNIDATLATTIRTIVMAGFLIFMSLFLGKLSFLNSINNKALQFIVFSGLAGAVSWLFYFLALKNGPASGVVALDRLSIVFVVILALIFFSEKITLQSGIGAALIVIGAVMMSL